MRRCVCAATCTAARVAYSSATFVASEQDEQQQQRQPHGSNNVDNEAMREQLRAAHNATADASSSSPSSSSTQRPTEATYAAMSTEELQQLLQLRATQVAELRHVYTHFHYEVERCYRHTVLDYHDKALQLSQVHGHMQVASLQVSREVLQRMREEQERLSRDLRLVLAVSTVVTVAFWLWVRRHYMRASLYTGDAQLTVEARALLAPSMTGPGGYGVGNPFSSAKRNARGRETAYEREVRERQEDAGTTPA